MNRSRPPTQIAVAAAVLVAVAAAPAASAGTGPAASAPVASAPVASVRTGTITQPAPPVTASAFPIEPAGTAPADGDGLIPNLQTPAGSAIGPPGSCTQTFVAATGGSTSAGVNAWIAANENAITSTTVVCLSGTFTTPIHVWGKSSVALLEIAPAPGSAATLSLGQVAPGDTNPNQFWSDSDGVSIVDSRSVEIYGLTVENYTWNGTGHSPAGIYVTVRSDTSNTNQGTVPHLSACFRSGGACGDIYILDNTVRNITNTADSNYRTKPVCGNGNVDAYGIAAIAAGGATSPPLQHLVIEGNTVTGTRTGQSETVTINGNITGFLAADNSIHDADNIGLDTIGWETGSAQARHGYVTGNTIEGGQPTGTTRCSRWTGSPPAGPTP